MSKRFLKKVVLELRISGRPDMENYAEVRCGEIVVRFAPRVNEPETQGMRHEV
jgi:hypothetical protein